MLTKFRAIRVSCQISQREIAQAVHISKQRLGQLETRKNSGQQNPERLISALESIVMQRKKAVEKAEYIFRHERDTLFDFIDGGDFI